MFDECWGIGELRSGGRSDYRNGEKASDEQQARKKDGE